MEHEIWCGSDASYEAVAAARESLKQFVARIPVGADSGLNDPLPYTKQGALGIIPIQGSLINGNAGWLSMFGVTGYADIQAGLIELATDPEIKSIMLLVNSGGGSVNGVQPTADLIDQVSQVKPITAHIDTVGGSAAYWLASSANSVSLDPMGQAGSIGAVMQHKSRSRMMTDAGIDTTIIRSGEYKMIGGPDEPLSELAKAELQSKVNDLNGMFTQHVAKQRGMSASDVEENMGKGRMYLGKRALTAGLVDKIQTQDEAIAAAKKKS